MPCPHPPGVVSLALDLNDTGLGADALPDNLLTCNLYPTIIPGYGTDGRSTGGRRR